MNYLLTISGLLILFATILFINLIVTNQTINNIQLINLLLFFSSAISFFGLFHNLLQNNYFTSLKI
jgi:hypothetical protein